MPSIYQLKPRFQACLRPLVQALARAGVTANQVTLSALLVSLLVAAYLSCLTRSPLAWLVLPAWLLVRMALNAVDGMLAREHQQQSTLGGIYNEVGDVLSDTALFLPFALLHPDLLWPVLACALFALISEYIGVLGPMLGASRRYDGPMGKSDRAGLLGLGALLYASGVISAAQLVWPLWAMLALLIVTCANRARQILREVRHD